MTHVATLLLVGTASLYGCGKTRTNEDEIPGAPVRLEIPDATCPKLDRPTVGRFLALSLECVDREYPNKPGNTLASSDEVAPPRAMTPAFFGCYDWHSAVHAHWAMTRVAKLFPDLPDVALAREKLLAHLTPENIAREVVHFSKPDQVSFERPYGWGWLLRLAHELATWDDPDGKRLRENLGPLTELLAKRSAEYLHKLSVPVRDGTHNNTAFALVHILDYAREVGDEALAATVAERARTLYGQDINCPISYEPSGEDFISPCFAEADIMRRVLPAAEFRAWLDKFVPKIASAEFQNLVTPIEVRDPKDPKIVHLIGLGFQRAWSLAGLASSFESADPRHDAYRQLSELHCEQAYRKMFDSGYGGTHWLASFAIYHLSGVSLDEG